jgi:hypothetical protein
MIGVYLASVANVLPDLGKVTLLLVFAIGPVTIAGLLRLQARLRDQARGPLLTTSMVFLVIAFALFTLMIVVQQTVVLQFREWRLEAGVNLVQRGIDVTFDIVYCFGVISLGVVLYQMVGFGRGLAAAGIFAAGVLLAANLATFPHPPAESGLIDLGPVTAVWWVLVILRLIRVGTPDGKAVLVPGAREEFPPGEWS